MVVFDVNLNSMECQVFFNLNQYSQLVDDLSMLWVIKYMSLVQVKALVLQCLDKHFLVNRAVLILYHVLQTALVIVVRLLLQCLLEVLEILLI